MVGEILLCCLPEAIFYDIIHFATGIAIYENGVFGGLRHLDHVLRLAPGIELSGHVAGGLRETQTDVVIAKAKFIAYYLPLSRHHASVGWCHDEHTIGRSRVSEVDLLAADGIVAYEVIDAGRARSVILELGVLPRFAIIPLGVGHARHIGRPVAHNLLINTRHRIVVIV